MAANKQKIGWIGVGRMGLPMAERLLKAGYDLAVWNRTRAKAQPLAKLGGKVVDNLFELKGRVGWVIETRIAITLLAKKMGIPRHAFLAFMNNSVMGSMFTRYKSPALVNLDWTTTFTPELLRKDLDLGLALGREWDVPMPVTAAAPAVLQGHFRPATLKTDPEDYPQNDLAPLIEATALASRTPPP